MCVCICINPKANLRLNVSTIETFTLKPERRKMLIIATIIN